MIHQLKILTGEFEAVQEGRMLHAVRVNDRAFAVGDQLALKEWIPVGDDCTYGAYTNRAVLRQITYITPGGSWGLGQNICVLSIK